MIYCWLNIKNVYFVEMCLIIALNKLLSCKCVIRKGAVASVQLCECQVQLYWQLLPATNVQDVEHTEETFKEHQLTDNILKSELIKMSLIL